MINIEIKNSCKMPYQYIWVLKAYGLMDKIPIHYIYLIAIEQDNRKYIYI